MEFCDLCSSRSWYLSRTGTSWRVGCLILAGKNWTLGGSHAMTLVDSDIVYLTSTLSAAEWSKLLVERAIRSCLLVCV